MVGKQRADDFATRLAAARRKKNKVERTARPKRWKGVHAHSRMQRVVAMEREVSQQRGGGVGNMRRVVEVAAEDGRHVPVDVAALLLVFEIGGELPELEKPPFPRAGGEMEIHDRHAAAMDVEFGEKKTFLARTMLAGSNSFP